MSCCGKCKEKLVVKIVVQGGVASVLECPDSVEVIIVDNDILEEEGKE